MKKTVFTGAATAIITPFKNGKIDYESFEKLINWQIDEGIDAIVVCGTTGEASTLTDDEHIGAIKFAVDTVAGRVPVIAGTGSNDTAYAIDLTVEACEAGADAAVLELKKYEALVQLSNGRASKIIVPTDVVNTAKSNTLFSEITGIGSVTPEAPAAAPAGKKADPCCDK